MKHEFLILLLVLLGARSAAHATSKLADCVRELPPGAVVTVADGHYSHANRFRIEGQRGTEKQPIILRAERRGGVVIEGKWGMEFKDCEHVILEGFTFRNDANQQGVLLEDCRHVRITRCTFRLDEKPKARWSQFWVYVIGRRSGHNRIDHNLFEQKKNRGSMIFIRGDDTTLTPSQHDRIDHNHFRDVIWAGGSNGHETLRTGSNDMGAAGKSSFAIIEQNLFERCSGEQEIISLKSSDNIVRNNTFIDCRGSICLRLGNRSEIAGNFLLNSGGVAGAGGVKIYGFEHRVTGNFFQGLNGTGHEAPLALIPGVMDGESTDQIGKAYQDLTAAPATRASIMDNTWIDCTPLIFGDERPNPQRPFTPDGCVFTGNIVFHTKPMKTPPIRLGRVRNFKAAENITNHENAGETPWARWFRIAAAPAPGAPPHMLTPGVVGPFAP